MKLANAWIQVERRGRFRYAATVIGRPEDDEDSPFQMPLMEQGPYFGRTHQSAWQKAWDAVGQPNIQPVEDL